jgi:pyruvate,water dikinase
VIEASYGIGASVVDGTITPDNFEVTESGEVRIRAVGSKRSRLELRRGGVVRVKTDVGSRSAQAITTDEAQTIARTVQLIEESMGGPQDVEWALDKDRNLIILQSRPITTAPSTITKDESL